MVSAIITTHILRIFIKDHVIIKNWASFVDIIDEILRYVPFQCTFILKDPWDFVLLL